MSTGRGNSSGGKDHKHPEQEVGGSCSKATPANVTFRPDNDLQTRQVASPAPTCGLTAGLWFTSAVGPGVPSRDLPALPWSHPAQLPQEGSIYLVLQSRRFSKILTSEGSIFWR